MPYPFPNFGFSNPNFKYMSSDHLKTQAQPKIDISAVDEKLKVLNSRKRMAEDHKENPKWQREDFSAVTANHASGADNFSISADSSKTNPIGSPIVKEKEMRLESLTPIAMSSVLPNTLSNKSPVSKPSFTNFLPRGTQCDIFDENIFANNSKETNAKIFLENDHPKSPVENSTKTRRPISSSSLSASSSENEANQDTIDKALDLSIKTPKAKDDNSFVLGPKMEISKLDIINNLFKSSFGQKRESNIDSTKYKQVRKTDSYSGQANTLEPSPENFRLISL